MAERRGMSPVAEGMRRPRLLGGGIMLLVIWLAITVGVSLGYSDDPADRFAMGIASQVILGVLALIGLIIAIRGILAERRARRFNTRDWALADALAESLGELWHQPPLEAYAPGDADVIVRQARLVEIERHFDSQTEGAITGTLAHRLQIFGSSFAATYGSVRESGSFTSASAGMFAGTVNGLSQVDLGVSTTTRDNLMGDALFSVFEAAGQAGPRDTYRVISMSRPAVLSWIDDLVGFASMQVGGPLTHAGSTLAGWSGNLAAQFAPEDISYTTDRLKAIASRPFEQRELVDVHGSPTGRNALIATSLSIGSGSPLLLMPARFPVIFGSAVAVAVARCEQRLTGSRPRPALPA